MSSCEKCWSDSAYDRMGWNGESPSPYHELLKRRNGITEPECTPEQQAGEDATVCPTCGRKCLHQWTGECMNPNCKAGRRQPRPETTKETDQ